MHIGRVDIRDLMVRDDLVEEEDSMEEDSMEEVSEDLISEILISATSWGVFLVVDLADDLKRKAHKAEKTSRWP